MFLTKITILEWSNVTFSSWDNVQRFCTTSFPPSFTFGKISAQSQRWPFWPSWSSRAEVADIVRLIGRKSAQEIRKSGWSRFPLPLGLVFGIGNRAENGKYENQNQFCLNPVFSNFNTTWQGYWIHCTFSKKVTWIQNLIKQRIWFPNWKLYEKLATFKTRADTSAPFIRVKDFSHLVLLLGLEGDVGRLHQAVLRPVLVDALSLRQHLVLLVVCNHEHEHSDLLII